MTRILVAILILISCTTVSIADSVVSMFDTGLDGWNVSDLRSYGPYEPSLGTYSLTWNSLGCYAGTHDPTGNSFFFNAPAKFLGDKSGYYGGQLTFSLRSTVSNWGDDNVVVLVGVNGKVLCSLINPLPHTTWTDYRIILLESNFRYNTKNGNVVTKADFQSVLQDIRALRICGEYGAQIQETTDIDNVVMATDHVVGMKNRDASGQIIVSAAPYYRFKLWGRVSIINSSSFWLDDGSQTPVKVYAPGYSLIANGDYAEATGCFSLGELAPTLNCAGIDVRKLQ